MTKGLIKSKHKNYKNTKKKLFFNLKIIRDSFEVPRHTSINCSEISVMMLVIFLSLSLSLSLSLLQSHL